MRRNLFLIAATVITGSGALFAQPVVVVDHANDIRVFEVKSAAAGKPRRVQDTTLSTIQRPGMLSTGSTSVVNGVSPEPSPLATGLHGERLDIRWAPMTADGATGIDPLRIVTLVGSAESVDQTAKPEAIQGTGNEMEKGPGTAVPVLE